MKRLFKYTSLEYAKQSLEGEYIYLSSPEKFNDVYDSSLGFRPDDIFKIFTGEISAKAQINNKSFIDIAKNVEVFSGYSTETAEDRFKFIEEILKEENFAFIKKIAEMNQNEFVDKLLEKSVEVLGKQPTKADIELTKKLKEFDFNEYINKIFGDKKSEIENLSRVLNGFDMRIGCLTENHQSNYMWALYGRNFKGVCLEYDFETLNKELDGNLFKVTYSKNRPIIEKESIFKFMDENDGGREELEKDILKTLTTKHIEFEKELEWRIIRINVESEFYTKSLKSIYLGYKLDESDVAFFKDYAETNKIGIYKMDLSDDSYNVNFVKL